MSGVVRSYSVFPKLPFHRPFYVGVAVVNALRYAYIMPFFICNDIFSCGLKY